MDSKIYESLKVKTTMSMLSSDTADAPKNTDNALLPLVHRHRHSHNGNQPEVLKRPNCDSVTPISSVMSESVALFSIPTGSSQSKW